MGTKSQAIESAPPEVTPRDIITEKIAEQTIGKSAQPDVEPGDIIRFLKDPEFFHHFGVVTKVAKSNSSCTAIVLERNKRFGVEERWPNLKDVYIENTKLRLGTHIIVNGLKNAQYQHFNGLAGRIVNHPREGHPAFVRKPKGPEKFLLTVLVQFDDQVAAGKPSVILEPRFLQAYDKENTVGQLAV